MRQAGFMQDEHHIVRNADPETLYQLALEKEKGTTVSSTGALVARSGTKTGRSPLDKRIVQEPRSQDDVWWGPVNKALPPSSFQANRDRAVSFLNECTPLFVFDGYAGWAKDHQIKVRVVCSRAYHALFMHNMLIRPTPTQLAEFGQPDFLLLNAGAHPADASVPGLTSTTSVALNFEQREVVILGTEYAGEMKKAVFTIMHYWMPQRGVLSLHSSANRGQKNGDVTLFFGLSGTGKTTLSADPHRALIGDDEHCWSPDGVFNIEGGCYAKTIDLTEAQEPSIFQAIRSGCVLENVVLDPKTGVVDYHDVSLTQNTRAAYPLEHIPNAVLPAVAGHPTNIILLTCDAFGVLPPVSRLTPAQAMYHFINGYTSKVAGTEMGVTEPEATFSACYGEPFLVLHPARYAEMLAHMMEEHRVTAWLVNTGWTGGRVGQGGQRCALAYSRAIIDAIHSGSLDEVEYQSMDTFGLDVPRSVPGVPSSMLLPRQCWTNVEEYDRTVQDLAQRFQQNFAQYASQASSEVCEAGPRLQQQ
jgi:phosphoenolpyruvate carboxykinase (ATP)